MGQYLLPEILGQPAQVGAKSPVLNLYSLAVLIISTAPELMKLIFAVLDTSLTMGLTRCYKTEGFFHLYLQFLYKFYAISIRYTRLNLVIYYSHAKF